MVRPLLVLLAGLAVVRAEPAAEALLPADAVPPGAFFQQQQSGAALEAFSPWMPLRKPNQDLVQIHIPKCAGTSLREELWLLDREKYGHLTRCGFAGCDEKCYADMYQPGKFHLTMVRSPRDHVFSQYMECRTGMGKAIKHTGFPKWGSVKSDFVTWLQYFVSDAPGARAGGQYGCYDPWNMQARALTCDSVTSMNHGIKPHGLGRADYRGRNVKPVKLEFDDVEKLRSPNWGGALPMPGSSPPIPNASATINLGLLDFVGVSELYSESWCVLLFQLGHGVLPPSCRPDAAESAQHRHKNHGITVDLESIQPERYVLEMIDRMTQVDQRGVYLRGVLRFLRAAARVTKATDVKLLTICRMNQLLETNKYIDGFHAAVTTFMEHNPFAIRRVC